MNIGQCVCLSLIGLCKLHAALPVDILYTKTHSDGFNGSEHPMILTSNSDSSSTIQHIGLVARAIDW